MSKHFQFFIQNFIVRLKHAAKRGFSWVECLREDSIEDSFLKELLK